MNNWLHSTPTEREGLLWTIALMVVYFLYLLMESAR